MAPKKKNNSEEEAVGGPKSGSNGAARPAPKRAPRKAVSAKTSTSRGGAGRRRKSTDGASVPTHDEISLRAYFIAEQRLAHGLPGDANTDWLEARRQLYVEVGLPTDKF